MFFAGILIHITFLFSIFDIYFKSPIVKNVVPYQPQHEHLAERLVLFVVDGLRAESFVNYTTMPYLRSVANSYGRWGISNTQVPTESRPGHVAVIAGFYEDPSAVAKGWKENPVDFDSVFNQTSYTWCWGTYDIVNIFTKANIDDHIVVHEFDPYDHTFSTDKNTTHLDAWVFDNVKTFFQKAKDDNNLSEKLKKNKIIFFLHLLGTDTAGHTHKPKTKNFLTTLSHVDEGIKEIEQVIRDYYQDDGKTTFLMTSDHGMTDWGSHGAGDDHETQTPYVIWGSGVKQVSEMHLDPETNGMSLDHRFDINQVDLSPLMSTILSIPVPVNSKGKLSTEFLDISFENKAKAIYSNSRQLASQYNKKRLDVEENAIEMLYKPYEPFSEAKYQELIEFTEKLLSEEEYETLILLSEEIIQLSLSGLHYYHNYYQQPLLLLVTAAFLGWVACLLKILTEQQFNTQVEPSNLKSYTSSRSQACMKSCMNTVFVFLCGLSMYLVYAQHLPVQYYLYFLLPIFLWWYALSSLTLWIKVYRQFRKNKQFLSLFVQILSYSLGSIAMGLSFTYRWMLSVPLLGMGLWPFLSSTRHHLSKQVLVVWPIGCALLSIFSFMPVVGKDVFIELVITAGIIWLVAIAVYIRKILLPLCRSNYESKREILLTAVQVVLLVVSLQNIYVQSKRFERGTPVSYYYQTLAWITAGVSLVIPLMFSKRLICRLLAINTSILNFYLLLSVSHEGLFIVALIFNLISWIFIEFKLLHLKNVKLVESSFENDSSELRDFTSIERGINSQDFRRSFFFVLYIILAFFGTGNIASLNSFEVRWVTCFITSFQPFIITALILLKTLAPFLSVACSFRGVQHLTKAPTGYLNIIVLIYSNFMGIQLLYNVKNTGSWLEIGTSISQFVIVQVITLFIVIINLIAKLLTDISIHSFADKLFKSRKKYV
ncbi:phosphatidylinositol glycan anchor biosynthesis class N [Anticarsia gemmatalis]|uniref:phosphatidylinositol glycan anchor biosynthesis class N n=1 Tax=Anticarsia gemmatalis TaxID=129554 RepID=UPI003F75F207